MAKKFYAQKDYYDYPIPGTMMSADEVPDSCVEIPAEDVTPAFGQEVAPRPVDFRYFVRRKPNGDVIPNSLFMSYDQPKGLVYEFKVITGTPTPAPTGLNYTTPNVFTVDEAITDLTPTVTGTVTSYSVSPALPAGLSLNTTTGVISGTPTEAAVEATYTVTASNPNGSVTKAVVITVEEGV